MNEKWHIVKEIFTSALPLDADERKVYLAAACAGDVELRQKVEELLSAYRSDFLEEPAGEEPIGASPNTGEDLAISGQRTLLESNPALARSLKNRMPYLDPLNHLQVELIKRHRARRADRASNERDKRGIHLTINGISAGLRNTG